MPIAADLGESVLDQYAKEYTTKHKCAHCGSSISRNRNHYALLRLEPTGDPAGEVLACSTTCLRYCAPKLNLRRWP